MRPIRYRGAIAAARQRGLTLLELMVAMVIALVVTLAAMAALLFAREGFSTLDATSQLRENGRFLTELLSRTVVQAGYRATASAIAQRNSRWLPMDLPDIEGYNSQLTSAAATEDPLGQLKSRTAANCGSTADSSCVTGGSDVLVVRFQGQNTPTGVADNSMLNCNGEAQGHVVGNDLTSDATNVFYVKSSTSGEPVLMCASRTLAGVWSATPLISGVESFQVLYGVDNVVPGAAVAVTNPASVPMPTAPTRWLRADQMVVPSDAEGTKRNWRRVTDLRIGIVMRSPPATGQNQAGTLYPFADGASSPFADSVNDPGSVLTVSSDRRFRQAMSFTVHLRNTLN